MLGLVRVSNLRVLKDLFWHNKLNVGEINQCLRVLWSQKQGQYLGRI
jgi:hypothetical protein